MFEVGKQVSAWEEKPWTLPRFMCGKSELDMASSDPEHFQDNSGQV